MNHSSALATPYRVGVYETVEEADRAVRRLLDAGFSKEQITVICSDESKERHFKRQGIEDDDPAGSNTPAAAAVGGTIGAVLGGLTAIAAGAATGGITLVVAGGAAAWTGGVLGGFLGAMMTRGGENELTDFYQQAVRRGDLLVAVEAEGQDAALERASQIFLETGAKPLPLAEG